VSAHLFLHLNVQKMGSNYFSETHSTATAIVISTVPLLYIVVRKVLYRLSAPIRDLPGPKSVNWLTGSLERHIWEPDAQDSQLEWTSKYGPVFKYYGLFNVSVHYVFDTNILDHRSIQATIIVTTDLQALNHILNAPEFEKTHADRQFLGQCTEKVGPHSLVSAPATTEICITLGLFFV